MSSPVSWIELPTDMDQPDFMTSDEDRMLTLVRMLAASSWTSLRERPANKRCTVTGGAYHQAIRRLPPTFQPISGRGGGGLGPAEGEGGTRTPTYMA